MNIMRQSACVVINPITVNSFASLFNCMLVGRASDSMMGPNIKLVNYLLITWLGLVLFLSVAWSFGVQLVVSFCSGISAVLFHTLGSPGVTIRFCRVLISDSS